MPGESGLIYCERASGSLRHEKGRIGFHQYPIQPERSRRILHRSRFFISHDTRKREIDFVGPIKKLAGECRVFAKAVDNRAPDAGLLYLRQHIRSGSASVDDQRQVQA